VRPLAGCANHHEERGGSLSGGRVRHILTQPEDKAVLEKRITINNFFTWVLENIITIKEIAVNAVPGGRWFTKVPVKDMSVKKNLGAVTGRTTTRYIFVTLVVKKTLAVPGKSWYVGHATGRCVKKNVRAVTGFIIRTCIVMNLAVNAVPGIHTEVPVKDIGV